MQQRGEVYSLLNGAQNIIRRQYGVLFRSLTAKNREKVRARSYFPVCLPLTHKVGTGSKGLRVTNEEQRSAKCSTLSDEAPDFSASLLIHTQGEKMGDKNKTGYEIRQGLLGQAQSILEQNAQMEYEITKKWPKLTAEQVIAEAEKLYAFVQQK